MEPTRRPSASAVRSGSTRLSCVGAPLNGVGCWRSTARQAIVDAQAGGAAIIPWAGGGAGSAYLRTAGQEVSGDGARCRSRKNRRICRGSPEAPDHAASDVAQLWLRHLVDSSACRWPWLPSTPCPPSRQRHHPSSLAGILMEAGHDRRGRGLCAAPRLRWRAYPTAAALDRNAEPHVAGHQLNLCAILR